MTAERNVLLDQFGRVRGRCWYLITVPKGWTIRKLEEHWSVPVNAPDMIEQWRKRANWWATLPEISV